MKVLIKVPNCIVRNKKLYLDLEMGELVLEVRRKISTIAGIPMSGFHLATSHLGIKILLTDTWPLSFFITEENPVLKLKLLEITRSLRKDSLVSTSMVIHNFSIANFMQTENPSHNLLTACKLGNFQMVKEVSDLIEKENIEEDIFNCVEDNKWSPLHYVCVSGELKILKFLLEKRVNCNKVTIDEWTPLQIATYFGRVEVVEALLQTSNLLINKKTKFRGTALHLACETGNEEILRLLLDKNACMSIDDHKGRKPIELARKPEVFELWAVYTGRSQLKKYSDAEIPIPFCSEVFCVNCFSLNDKSVFLYLDVESGLINRYMNKEQFLDKAKPEHYTRTIDIQEVKLEYRRKNQYVFSIETSRSVTKYFTRYEVLSLEWVERIKKAIEFYMVNKQNGIIEHISEPVEESNEDESTDTTNPVVSEEVVDFSSFSVMEEIGNGAFGIVYKVSKINSGQVFAMKSLSKTTLQKQKQLKYAISECKIMKQLNHPFIVPLYYAFQTPKYLYLILELCPNGDLLGLLEKKGLIEENLARFYIAEVILALEYLHEADIIYRDLKPANVLIASDYHIKLADFGLAKEKVNKVNPAMTMAGSPAYLPPEIVAKKGATTASDVYGLGPLLYELLTGRTPYYSDDIDLLFQNIKTAKLSFPEFVSANARDLIGLVMNKEPAKRPQISQIKRHPFFRKLDWEALLARRIKPPRQGIESFDEAV